MSDSPGQSNQERVCLSVPIERRYCRAACGPGCHAGRFKFFAIGLTDSFRDCVLIAEVFISTYLITMHC